MFNGIDYNSVLHGDQGIVWKKGKDSKKFWKFDFDEGKYGDVYGIKWSSDTNKELGLVLDTSSPFLEIPMTDFITL